MGLIELYLKLGKPIGSNTLREHGFEAISSATIRNTFSQLEKEGYLHQAHISGGRIPTEAAFRLYAQEALSAPLLPPDVEERLTELRQAETRNLNAFLHTSAELLSATTGCAAFLSSARFDHDLLLDMKLVGIDSVRFLCILITDFGQIFTEVMTTEHKLSTFALKRLENHFLWRLKGQKLDPPPLFEEEEQLAQTLYNEIMIRYIVRYSNFSDEEVHRTGFSRLLAYPEFSEDPIALTTGLSLFENLSHLRRLLSECTAKRGISLWVGKELSPHAETASTCSALAIPYTINGIPCGAIGVLGPLRIPYRSLFGILQLFAENMSHALTKTFYKFKLSFRQAHASTPYLKHEEQRIVGQTTLQLLEKKE